MTAWQGNKEKVFGIFEENISETTLCSMERQATKFQVGKKYNTFKRSNRTSKLKIT